MELFETTTNMNAENLPLHRQEESFRNSIDSLARLIAYLRRHGEDDIADSARGIMKVLNSLSESQATDLANDLCQLVNLAAARFQERQNLLRVIVNPEHMSPETLQKVLDGEGRDWPSCNLAEILTPYTPRYQAEQKLEL